MSNILEQATANGLGSLAAMVIFKAGEVLWILLRKPGRSDPQITPRQHKDEKGNSSKKPQQREDERYPSSGKLQQHRNETDSSPIKPEEHKPLWSLRRIHLVVFIGVFILIPVVSSFTPFDAGGTLVVWLFGLPTQNEQWTADAWTAMNQGNPTKAIGSAEKVIDNFADDAVQAEEALERSQEAPPPVGHIGPSESERIFARGPLNDVATAYWIAGQAYEQMGNFLKACENYRGASKLRYGRTWDPVRWRGIRGWTPWGQFWSPAMKASGRIRSKCGGNPIEQTAPGNSRFLDMRFPDLCTEQQSMTMKDRANGKGNRARS